MSAKYVQSMVVAAAFAGATFGFSSEAHAIDPVDKGTIVIAAERMTGFALLFGGPQVDIAAGVLMGGIPSAFNYPRIGFDYFVIDGLSIGGNLGVSHNSAANYTLWSIQPRIGYAFALSPAIDFWPRGGVGVRGQDNGNGGGSSTTAVISLEPMFLWNIFEHVGMEFGPTLDVGLANGYGTELGGNVGLFMRF